MENQVADIEEIYKKNRRLHWIIVLISVSAAASVIAVYIGMAQFMQQERKSVMGVMYSSSEEAADLYARAILDNHVSKVYTQAGVQAMGELGYSESAFLNVSNQYPINNTVMIGMAVMGVSLAGFLIYGFMNAGFLNVWQHDERKYYEMKKRMKGMNESLELKNRQTKAFVENVAHQLRTPISYVYFELDGMETESSRACLKSLDKVNELLNTLLRIARMESGKVIMEYGDYDIEEFLRNICAGYGSDRVRLQVQSETEDRIVHMDEEWMQEALVNIVNNGCEHSKAGSPVDVVLFVNAAEVRIDVVNTGSEISEKDMAHLFDRFYTAENVLYSHTGIGLNLADLIVKKHNGKIRIQSADQSTICSIVLPRLKMTEKADIGVYANDAVSCMQ